MSDSLHDRGKAIEDIFFAGKDQILLARIRDEIAADASRAALESASGISDVAVLDALSACGITPESLVSVALIPLVVVGWADDKMEDAEKVAILQAADVAGIRAGSASYDTLESWLSKKPAEGLLDSWKAYIHALKVQLDDISFAQLRSSLMGRSKTIAESAGGILGIHSISSSEKSVMDELAKAFD